MRLDGHKGRDESQSPAFPLSEFHGIAVSLFGNLMKTASSVLSYNMKTSVHMNFNCKSSLFL